MAQSSVRELQALRRDVDPCIALETSEYSDEYTGSRLFVSVRSSTPIPSHFMLTIQCSHTHTLSLSLISDRSQLHSLFAYPVGSISQSFIVPTPTLLQINTASEAALVCNIDTSLSFQTQTPPPKIKRKTTILLTTALTTFLPLTSDDGGSFTHNCPTPIYTRSATCETSGHDATLVQPGSTYDHNLYSRNPGCNRATKISDSEDGLDSDCYNVEWVVDTTGEMWYNLSHDHGNPFKDLKRTMSVEGCEEVIRCEEGEEGV